MDNISLVFIGGRGRSGSTLLELLLNNNDQIISVGEIYNLWDRGLEQNQLCSCGSPFRECEFWRSVFEIGFGGFDRFDVKRVKKLHFQVNRFLYLPKMFFKPLFPKFQYSLREYSQILEKLYTGIAKASGKNVIVDASKIPSHGFVLRGIKVKELFLIHLVRDSRAVAYSWQKKVKRPEIQGENVLMPRYSIWKTAFGWTLFNLFMHLLRFIHKNSILVRYEDLVAKPRQEIDRILEFIGSSAAPKQLLDTKSIYFRNSHTVSGNPLRFKIGRIKIEEDQEWKSKLSVEKRRAMKFLTWPLLKIYGYI